MRHGELHTPPAAQDNFYRHVNQHWLESAEIPPSKVRHGMISQIQGKIRKTLLAIVLDRPSEWAGPLESDHLTCRSLFNSFVAPDVSRVEAQRNEIVHRIISTKSFEHLVRVMAHLEASGSLGFFWLDISASHYNPNAYAIELAQSGISLPSRQYYEDPSSAPLIEAFVQHVERVLTLSGLEEPAALAQAVLSLEASLAKSHITASESRRIEDSYEIITRTDLNTVAPSFPWGEYFTSLGLTDVEERNFVVSNLAYLEALSVNAAQTKLSTWKAWSVYHFTHSFAPYLGVEIASENHNFYSRILFGTEDRSPIQERALNFVSGAASEELGRLYVASLSSSSFQSAYDVVLEIRDTFRASFANSDLDTQTKLGALRKLDSVRIKVGAPSAPTREASLIADPENPLENAMRAARLETAHGLNKIGKQVDHLEWFLPPYSINAYYNPTGNEIVIPAGILQEPFFSESGTKLQNIAGLGVIVGHELAHAFDDQGRLFDWDGRRWEWSSRGFAERWNREKRKLVASTERLRFDDAPTLKVDGALVVGELFADVLGLRVALDAAAMHSPGDRSAHQELLARWAMTTRTLYRKGDLERLLKVDPHLPSELRCNATVQHIDNFYEAYDVTSENGLWLAPGERLMLWSKHEKQR